MSCPPFLMEKEVCVYAHVLLACFRGEDLTGSKAFKKSIGCQRGVQEGGVASRAGRIPSECETEAKSVPGEEGQA